MTDHYWDACRATADAVRAAQPTTGAELVAILNALDPSSPAFRDGQAFWSASNADEDLWPILCAAGWELEWMNDSYYWQAHHPTTGDVVRYVEGDIYVPATTPADAGA